MNEAMWLHTSDAVDMIRWLRNSIFANRLTPRTSRLIALALSEWACNEPPWHPELTAARGRARSMAEGTLFIQIPRSPFWVDMASPAEALDGGLHNMPQGGAWLAAAYVREVLGNVYRPQRFIKLCDRCAGYGRVYKGRITEDTPVIYPMVECPECSGVGGEYEEPPWLVPLVRRIALDIYLREAWREMPVLGDALEEAGCPDQEMILHCHGQIMTDPGQAERWDRPGKNCRNCGGVLGPYTDMQNRIIEPNARYCYHCGAVHRPKLLEPARPEVYGASPVPHCLGCWVLDAILDKRGQKKEPAAE